MAFITAYMLPRLLENKTTKKTFTVFAGFMAGWLALSAVHFVFYFVPTAIPERFALHISFLLAGAAFLAGTFLVLFAPQKKPRFVRVGGKRARIAALSILVVANCAFNTSLALNASFFTIFADKNTGMKSAGWIPEDNASALTGDDSFFREGKYCVTSEYYFTNRAIVTDYYGVSEYWSMMNDNYIRYLSELELSSRESYCDFSDYNNRTVMLELASVKYFIRNMGDDEFAFGYEEIDGTSLQGNYRIYKNRYALPLGYVYSKAVPYGEYARLNPVEKQETLMQAAVLDDEFAGASVGELRYNTVSLPYEITEAVGMALDGGVLSVTEPDAYMVISFDGLENSETYIRFAGLSFTDYDNYDGQRRVVVKDSADDRSASALIYNSLHMYYYGKDDFTLNMGYRETPVSGVTFTAPEGEYALGDIRVLCYPLTDYPAQVEALRADVLENIETGVNRVRGDVRLEQDGIMVFGIPYSNGWTAYVNGEKQKPLRANTAFMALPLKAGDYSIEFRYFTPGLKAGFAATVSGAFICAVAAVVSKLRDKKNPQPA
jgi:uncharacterized membrane protein YfhO